MDGELVNGDTNVGIGMNALINIVHSIRIWV